MWVCGAGAFTVLKALAFKGRGENKDAYDLLYVLQNFGTQYVVDVARALQPLLDDAVTKEALEILQADFCTPISLGPMRAAAFFERTGDEAYRSDLSAAVLELLRVLA